MVTVAVPNVLGQPGQKDDIGLRRTVTQQAGGFQPVQRPAQAHFQKHQLAGSPAFQGGQQLLAAGKAGKAVVHRVKQQLGQGVAQSGPVAGIGVANRDVKHACHLPGTESECCGPAAGNRPANAAAAVSAAAFSAAAPVPIFYPSPRIRNKV